jgi:hypothetical protein
MQTNPKIRQQAHPTKSKWSPDPAPPPARQPQSSNYIERTSTSLKELVTALNINQITKVQPTVFGKNTSQENVKRIAQEQHRLTVISAISITIRTVLRE